MPYLAPPRKTHGGTDAVRLYEPLLDLLCGKFRLSYVEALIGFWTFSRTILLITFRYTI
jgi:hypothetical protein